MEVKTFKRGSFTVRAVKADGVKYFSMADVAPLYGYAKGANLVPKSKASSVEKKNFYIPDKSGRMQNSAFIKEADLITVLFGKKDIEKFAKQTEFMKFVSDCLDEKEADNEPVAVAKTEKAEKTAKAKDAAKAAKKEAKTEKKNQKIAEKKEVKKEAAKTKAEKKTAKTEAGNKEQPKRQYMSVSGFAAMIMQLVNKQNLVIVPDEAMKANG